MNKIDFDRSPGAAKEAAPDKGKYQFLILKGELE